jgi:hypothetical protein
VNKQLQQKLKTLPRSPGVYFHKSASGEIIYIGKAAVLKNRVRQYFQSSKDFDAKTRALVAEIYDTDWIETESEIDALFLESEMIKRYMPRYNILLRDDTEMQCPTFPDDKIGDFDALCREWLPIPPEYFYGIQEAHGLEHQLHQSVEVGRAAVIAAERDWNTNTPLIVSSWRRSWQLRGLHGARQRAIVIPEAGHSLHPSGENKHLAPLSQRQACQLVVDAGLKILNTSFPGRELK